MPTLYLPEDILRRSLINKEAYCYGFKGKDWMVVAGVFEGGEEEARKRIKSVESPTGTIMEVLGDIKHGSEPTRETGEAHRDHLFGLVLPQNDSPHLSSLGNFDSDPTIIIFSPPRSEGMLSHYLLPLKLSQSDEDLTAPTLNITISRPVRREGAPPRRKLKVEDIVGDELEQCIEWINLSRLVSLRLNRGSVDRSQTSPKSSPPDTSSRIPSESVETRSNFSSTRIPLIGRFAKWSAAARQVSTRFELLLAMPRNYWDARSLKSEHNRKSEVMLRANASYILFWNAVWLLANDLIIGYALASFVRDNTLYLSNSIETLVQTYISGYLHELLDWLNNWPGGVKLNTELSTLICDSFLFLSRLWQGFFLQPFLPHLPSILHVLSITGYLGGASLSLAFASDLITILTFPFFACYVAATLVYRWSLVGLSALFNVFRGKKFNPLRNRTEPANYSVDALLLGTILFVTLIFLFPTIAAFYLAFASSRLTIVAIQTIFGIMIQAINAFPLFAVMLRLKSPGRIPGGIHLRMCSDTKHWNASHWHLENRPLAFSAILSGLTDLAKAFFSPQTQLNLFTKICTGKVIFSSPLQS